VRKRRGRKRKKEKGKRKKIKTCPPKMAIREAFFFLAKEKRPDLGVGYSSEKIKFELYKKRDRRDSELVAFLPTVLPAASFARPLRPSHQIFLSLHPRTLSLASELR